MKPGQAAVAVLLALLVAVGEATGLDNAEDSRVGHASSDSYSKQGLTSKTGQVASNRRLLLAAAPHSNTTANTTANTTNATSVKACPLGARRVKCKIDPCKTCPSNTTCVLACGTCKATCHPALPHDGHNQTHPLEPIRLHADAVNVTGHNATMRNNDSSSNNTSSDACPGGERPFNCLVNPCASLLCVPPAVCTANYCGGCNATCSVPEPAAPAVSMGDARNYIEASESEQKPGSSGPHAAPAAVMGRSLGRCKDGKQPANCPVDPCQTPYHFMAKCGPGFICEADACNGCTHVCRPQGELASPWVPAASTCADGSRPVDCFVDPCETKQCTEDELCVRNYCGGCNAVCRPTAGSKPHPSPAPARACKDGSDPVRCLADPCSNMHCGDGLVCESNYCGGCNAVCKQP